MGLNLKVIYLLVCTVFLTLVVSNVPASGATTVDKLTAVTSNSADEWCYPAWSPDGDEILFRRNGEIYKVFSDGSGETRLTNTGGSVSVYSWSPDGSRILYSSSNANYTYDLWVMNSDGSAATRVTFPTEELEGDSCAAWSPDGSKIAYVSIGEAFIDNYGVDIHLIVMDSDGSNKQSITELRIDSSYFAIAWSPDSSKITFTSSSEYDTAVYVVNPDGSGFTRAAYGYIEPQTRSWQSEVWSPDGSTIICWCPEVNGDFDAIFAAKADGSSITQLTEDGIHSWHPRFSPDGSRIVFSSNSEIWIMDENGDNKVQLTNSPSLDDYPVWSPDGTKIAFCSDRDGYNNIWVMDLVDNSTDDANEAKNIIDILEADGNFTTFISALEAANLSATLNSEEPLTVFAPTDDAFAALPEGTLDALMDETDKLKEVLLYHLVDGTLMAEDTLNLVSISTLQGDNITFNVADDGSLFVEDAEVILVAEQSYGVIYAIDAVLIPPENEETPEYPSTELPDLMVQSITRDISSPKIGDTITFDVHVYNEAPVPAGSSTLGFYVDGVEIESSFIPELEAYTGYVQTFSWVADRAGDVQVSFISHADFEVAEREEPANEMGINFSISPLSPSQSPEFPSSELPYLMVQSVSLNSSHPSTGDTINFDVRVYNEASVPAGNSTLGFYVGGIEIESVNIPELEAYTGYVQAFSWVADRAGDVQISFVLHADFEVAEREETANEKTINLSIVSSASSPESSPPVAEFTSDVIEGIAPLTVHFSDLSSGAAVWNWDFGDGFNSTEKNPVHTYQAEGNYKAVLTIHNQSGAESISEGRHIVVSSEPEPDTSENDSASGNENSSSEVNNDSSSSFSGPSSSSSSDGSGGSGGGGGGSGSSGRSGSEGSGGGGGGGSPEPASNVEIKELSQQFVTSGNHVKFGFPRNVTCITYVEFDPKRSFGKVTTIVEMLKGQSAVVPSLPSGMVYRHVNIWVGNEGTASPQNIDDGIIGFRVEKAWIGSNRVDESEIRLCRHNEEKWGELSTRKVREDDIYVYFEAETPGFSPFSITVPPPEGGVAGSFALAVEGEDSIEEESVESSKENDSFVLEASAVEVEGEKESAGISGNISKILLSFALLSVMILIGFMVSRKQS